MRGPVVSVLSIDDVLSPAALPADGMPGRRILRPAAIRCLVRYRVCGQPGEFWRWVTVPLGAGQPTLAAACTAVLRSELQADAECWPWAVRVERVEGV